MIVIPLKKPLKNWDTEKTRTGGNGKKTIECLWPFARLRMEFYDSGQLTVIFPKHAAPFGPDASWPS
jgi:hypothetical protein